MLKVYYAGSFDPPHLGHLNTFMKAKEMLNVPIGIAICLNEFKKNDFLTLEERFQMCQMTFGTSDIQVFLGKKEIIDFFVSCDKVVRGIGRDNDMIDINHLLRYYNVEYLKYKIVFVKIENTYLKVSSSDIRAKLMHRDYSCREQLDVNVYKALVEKLKNVKEDHKLL